MVETLETQTRRNSQSCHRLFTNMSKALSKEDLEQKIEELKSEARQLKLRLSCIEDQISDFVGDLRMMDDAKKQTP